jgi:hypothetical protein
MSINANGIFELDIKKFDIKKVKHNKIYILIGKRNSGKTYLLKYILFHMQAIPIGIIVSRTEYMNKSYKKFAPAAIFKHEYSDKLLAQFVSRQMDETDRYEEEIERYGYSNINPEAFLIFDDCLDDTKWCTNVDIKFIFYNGRHAKITFFLCMQHPMGIPPSLRTQADYVFIFNDENIDNRQRIYKQYCGMFPSFAIFNKVMKQLTGDYQCIVVDNTDPTSKTVSEKVFYYKAPQTIVPFKLCTGTPELWENNEKNWQIFRRNVRIDREEKNKGKSKAKPKIKDEVLIRKVENKLKNEPGKYNPGIDLNFNKFVN